MNGQIIFGILLLVFGVIALVISQLLLRSWIKKYNREWNERIDNNEMS